MDKQENSSEFNDTFTKHSKGAKPREEIWCFNCDAEPSSDGRRLVLLLTIGVKKINWCSWRFNYFHEASRQGVPSLFFFFFLVCIVTSAAVSETC